MKEHLVQLALVKVWSCLNRSSVDLHVHFHGRAQVIILAEALVSVPGLKSLLISIDSVSSL